MIRLGSRGRAKVAEDGQDAPVAGVGCPFAPRCPLVEDVCWRVDPPLTALPDGHQVACHVRVREAGIAA